MLFFFLHAQLIGALSEDETTPISWTKLCEFVESFSATKCKYHQIPLSSSYTKPLPILGWIELGNVEL